MANFDPSKMAAASPMLKEKQDINFDAEWVDMKPTVLKLLRQENVSRAEWQDLFWKVYNVCMWDEKCLPKVLGALQQEIKSFVLQVKEKVVHDQDENALLRAYIREWSKYFTQSTYLPMPFNALEKMLVSSKDSTNNQQKKTSKVEEDSEVRKNMLDFWNLYIFDTIKQPLKDRAMALLYKERNSETFDKQLISGVRESFVNLCSNSEDRLQIYRESFEAAYLETTESFYKTQAPEYLAENGVQNYMRYADEKLKEEEERALRYLDTGKGSNSLQLLVQACVNVLVKSFKDEILRECAPMIKINETAKLNLMLRLMDRVTDGISPMLEDLEQHIREAGLADMVSAAEVITTDSEKYVERLLELFHRFSSLVREAFSDDPRFLTARDKAYEHVVNDTKVFRLELNSNRTLSVKRNQNPNVQSFLANYCDMLLRRTPLSKKLTSEEIETKLKNVLLVLKYVQNKDVFMRYHKVHLTRRLILDTSADSEKEENMVEWLREVGMPADYVNKLARMFQDIKVSEDLNSSFRDLHRNNQSTVSDNINIKILNAGAWSRSSERVPVSLPLELEDFIPEVEEFYKNKHSGRKLQWHHLMSNGIISFKNEVGVFDLEVTTFQMAVLFAWNQRPKDKISFENLRLASELPENELRKTLWSLIAFAKLKRQVILCSPECKSPKEFSDSTMFSINQQFAMIKNGKPQRRGKVNMIGRLQLSTERSTDEDKEGIVQLRILRTQELYKDYEMRKQISNAQLQTETGRNLEKYVLAAEENDQRTDRVAD
ncbi:putative cullin-5 [Apostichopus japonicus]|uniref:Cullin-5 n=1 Tax=Stichopus japonicus TaxID=307972 RepID=A0A2G8L9R1_STIJA|nr:putative cullin-5 [Apostichopus japonicus]